MQDDNMNNLSASPTPQGQPSTEPVESIEAVSVQQDVNITHANEPEPIQPMPTVQLGQSAEPAPIQTDQTASLEGASVNTPVVTDATANNTTEPVKKNNKTLVIVLSIVAALVIVAAVVVAIVMSVGNNKEDSAFSMIDVEDYCNSNNYEVEKQSYEGGDTKGDMITCEKSEEDFSAIYYITLNEPITDSEDLKELYSQMGFSGNGYLINEDNYKKMYYSIFGMTEYLIVKDNSIIVVVGTENDGVKNILLDLGYPDDKWGEGSSMDIDYDFNFNLNDDEDEDDNNKPSIIQDTQNSNDSNIDDSYFVSDDTKYVLTINGDYFEDEDGGAPSAVKMHEVFEYSGDTITGVTIYLEYTDAATAKIAFDYYSSEGIDESTDNVYVNDRYLVAEISQEFYEDLTVDEVRMQIELMEKMDDMDIDDYESLFESYGE